MDWFHSYKQLNKNRSDILRLFKVDLVSLKETHGSQLTILAGIDAGSIEIGVLTELQEQKFCRRIIALAKWGGFILGSSCGLYSHKSLQTLPELYRIADQCLRSNEK